MSSRFAVGKNKKSLKDIADQLNAVHKNTTLEQAFESRSQHEQEQKFRELFENDGDGHSNSRSRTRQSNSSKDRR